MAALAVLAAPVPDVALGAPASENQPGAATRPASTSLKSSGSAARIPADLFGWAGVAYPPAPHFAKWGDMLARYRREQAMERDLCRRGDCGLQRWREWLGTLKGAAQMAQLRAVNDYFNRVPYRTDRDNYGIEDYWATPREFLAKGGDCEDYAIAKYLSLRALGWPAERLRVAVVHDRTRNLVHAALIAYHEGNAYLLDIEIAAVTDHRQVGRYVPIFAISEMGWWSYTSAPPETPSPAVAAAPADAVIEPTRSKELPADADVPARRLQKSVRAVHTQY